MSVGALSEGRRNFLFFINIIEEEVPKALRQAFKSFWDNKYAQTFGTWDDSYYLMSYLFSEMDMPMDYHSYEEWDFDTLVAATLYCLTFSGKIIEPVYCLVCKSYFDDHILDIKKNSLGDTFFTPDYMGLKDKRTLAIYQLQLLKDQHERYKSGNIIYWDYLEIDPMEFNKKFRWAREAFTALGVSTAPLDVTRKFSVVNEFSAVGLQSLIEQHGQGTSKDWRSNGINIWIRGKYLGGGNFGKVYTLTNSHTRAMVAMKIVEIEPQYTEAKEEVKQLENEIDILSKLRHERIVSFHGSEQKGNHFYLFMDFMAKGSLHSYIKRNGKLDENLSRKYTRQILEGVLYLHSKDIIHRDIKGPNILLDNNSGVKLADFGLSKKIEKIGSKTDLSSFVGTPYWMAPEILWGKGYGRRVDIWSVGCTVVEMLTGCPPLRHLEPQAAMFQIGNKPLEPELPEGVSQDANDFVRATLTWLPAERPLSEELLGHAFVLTSNITTEDQEN